MALSGSTFSGILTGLLAAQGNIGPDVKNLADAVGNGIVQSVVGKSFVTVDSGSTAGAGQGTGVGVVMIPGLIAPLIFAQSVSTFGGSGPALLGLCQAIDQAVTQGMLTASLTSTNTPVFAGAGTITPGSINVPGSEVGANVAAAGVQAGLLGLDFPNFANAAGEGIGPAFSTATGSVVIAGAGGPGTPGAGAGQGTIS